MSMLGNYIKVAVRNLLRHKVYSAINIAGLAVGLACCLVIALPVCYHLSFDRFQRNFDRLCRITIIANFKDQELIGHGGSFGPMGRDFMNDYPEVAGYARLYMDYATAQLRYADTKIEVWSTCYSEPAFFDLFSFELAAGDPKTALSAPNSLVLTQRTAHNLFGDKDPLDQMVELNDGVNGKTTEFVVTGVLKDIPLNSHIRFDILLPLQRKWKPEALASYHSYPDFFTYFLLAPGTDCKELERKAAGYFKEHKTWLAEELTLILQPLRQVHLYSGYLRYDLNWRKNDISTIYVFSAVAFLILLIAGINFVNLYTARSAGRAREVGIRKVVGASRYQLIGQFLCESVLVCFCAMFLARAILELAQVPLKDFFGTELDLELLNGLPSIGALAVLTVALGILAGWYPALMLSLPRPQDVLKAAGRSRTKGLGLRRTLVVAQFTASVILVVCSIFIGKQLHWINSKDLGFKKDNTLNLNVPETVWTKREAVRQELLACPAILDVSYSGPGGIGQGVRGTTFHFEGENPNQKYMTNCIAVDYNFVRFYGLSLIEGRDFSEEMSSDTSGAFIINEKLMKSLGWNGAVGRKLWLDEDKGTGQELGYKQQPGVVIGVVRDFNFRSLYEAMEPLTVYVKPSSYCQMAVRIRPEKQSETIKFLEEKWFRYDPSSFFGYSFLDEDIASQYQSEQRSEILVISFSLLAILIACLGLLGLISFTAESRTKEIGIRKVLGASVPQIVYLLSKEFLLLLGIAAVIAWPVAWYAMDRWLSNFAYRIDLDWFTFILAGLIALAVAAATVSYQAVKAATANPVDALRYE
ncbi:MAG: ABC transporter permease [Candidatus Glassbacteria bacterium]|nr:ABC transporter permease [Candidatus Glassbacteria bacterium]